MNGFSCCWRHSGDLYAGHATGHSSLPPCVGAGYSEHLLLHPCMVKPCVGHICCSSSFSVSEICTLYLCKTHPLVSKKKLISLNVCYTGRALLRFKAYYFTFLQIFVLCNRLGDVQGWRKFRVVTRHSIDSMKVLSGKEALKSIIIYYCFHFDILNSVIS